MTALDELDDPGLANLLITLAAGLAAGVAIGYGIGYVSGVSRLADGLASLDSPRARELALAHVQAERGRPAPRGFELAAVESESTGAE